MKNPQILSGPLHKAILLLAFPIMLNNLIGTLYNLGDAYWVSRLGDIQVGAINFVWPVSFFTLSVAMGISIAGGAIISQYIGAGKHGDAKETAQQLYVFGVLFGVVSSLLGWFLSPSILKLMNASPQLYDAGVGYLKILFLEMPFLFLMNIFLAVNQAQGDTVTPTIVNGTSALLNILLDPLFIFTFGLGMEGAAIATVLSKVPFALYGVYHMGWSKKGIRIRPQSLSIHREKMLDLIRIGVPSSLGNSGVALGFIVLFSVVASYGDVAVTALGIGNRLNGLAFMPAVGIGAALSTVAGQNLGAANIPRVKKAFLTSIGLALAFLALTSSALWFFSRELVGIFSDTPEVVEAGSFYLKALASTTWSISFFNCSIGLFNGSGHTRYSMFLEAGRLWAIRMPLIVLLAGSPTLGIKGIWYGIAVSNIVAAAIAYGLTHTGAWKHAVVGHGKLPLS
ncbi:MATE family efflux transporter [Anaerotalea alkaliphila]|uniref:Probable multidrug resistance protein NorM n=1 Tax=Anaerotalea alkaliphila TaxID=2662126 RepID=A0A7X5KN83_9FIRM|nr:MATE family efflux transporter [Anaerotalea alkaliphila]NDL67518.1 MATE family efflux transporter [Anaerotalea alkaliphila]